jgi:hypothetical protein
MPLAYLVLAILNMLFSVGTGSSWWNELGQHGVRGVLSASFFYWLRGVYQLAEGVIPDDGGTNIFSRPRKRISHGQQRQKKKGVRSPQSL